MKIGILTSGGDCPGINATIRGVCKTAMNHYKMEVYGIHNGFRGLLDDEIVPLGESSLTGLLSMGGTILGTSREKPFKKHSNTSLAEEKSAAILNTIRKHALNTFVIDTPDITSNHRNCLFQQFQVLALDACIVLLHSGFKFLLRMLHLLGLKPLILLAKHLHVFPAALGGTRTP